MLRNFSVVHYVCLCNTFLSSNCIFNCISTDSTLPVKLCLSIHSTMTENSEDDSGKTFSSNETHSSPLPPLVPARPPKPDIDIELKSDSSTPPPVPANHAEKKQYDYVRTNPIKPLNKTDGFIKKPEVQTKPKVPAMSCQVSNFISLPPAVPIMKSCLAKQHSLPPTLYSTCSIYESIQLSQSRQQLNEIVHDHVLPLRVAFCDSLYGVWGSMTILRDDIFDVHFIKETVMAKVLKSNGSKLKVPLLTAGFQFTLVNSPKIIQKDDCTIAQLMKLGHLPKVAFIKKGTKKSKSGSAEFVKGDVLILQSRNKSGIQCISLTSYDKKTILKTSEILVDINPSYLRFCFTDLIYFSTPLLVQIEAPLKVERMLFQLPCTIQSLSNEKSVIVSCSNLGKDLKHFEIYLDVPIDFQTAGMLKHEKEVLLEKSKLLYDQFSPSIITKVISNSNQQKQIKIFELPATTDDDWKKVVTLCKPKAFTDRKAKHDSNQYVELPKEAEYDSILPVPELMMSNPCYFSTPVEKSKSSFYTTQNSVKLKAEDSSLLKLEDFSEDQVRILLLMYSNKSNHAYLYFFE